MKVTLLAMAPIAVPVSKDAVAQNGEWLVGAWILVSASSSGDVSKNEAPFGSNPKGILLYTSDAKMSAIITYGGRKPFPDDRISAPIEEGSRRSRLLLRMRVATP